MLLTIGMATTGDVDGTFFTVQNLRAKECINNDPQIEILIIDNKGNSIIEDWVKAWGGHKVRYVKYLDTKGTSQTRNKVFEEAKGEYVLCIDSHVLLINDLNLYHLIQEMDEGNLIQGPLLYDSFDYCSTHWKSIWQDNMWGVWSDAIPLYKLPQEPFEIEMQGLGLFGCKKSAWLKFNPAFRGFGGEEGYIHEKYRQAGKKTICLPWLLWNHKFISNKQQYLLNIEDRIRNYIIGFTELNLNSQPIIDHFGINVIAAICKKFNIKMVETPQKVL